MIEADCAVKPDGQNLIISFVISKWLLQSVSFTDRWSRGTKTLGMRLNVYCLQSHYSLALNIECQKMSFLLRNVQYKVVKGSVCLVDEILIFALYFLIGVTGMEKLFRMELLKLTVCR